jgi:hypothetical protein
MGGGWGVHILVDGFQGVRGLLGACGGVVVGVVSWVGLGCSVSCCCRNDGLQPMGCWGLLVLGDLL